MPLSKDEFERGRRIPQLERRVLSYLIAHPDVAYSAPEVARAVRPSSSVDLLSGVVNSLATDSALRRLAAEGKLRKRQVGAETFYMFDSGLRGE